MIKVERNEIIDYQTYGETRKELKEKVIAAKILRRITVGNCFMFLFENHLTIKYQIQEMVRIEKIVKEKNIQHEIDTYNELLGEQGALGCTFQIEINDPEERDKKLREWMKLPDYIYLKLEDGTRVGCKIDERQRDKKRLSSVQFLKFEVNGKVPVAVGVDYPGIEAETVILKEQQAALAEDLAC